VWSTLIKYIFVVGIYITLMKMIIFMRVCFPLSRKMDPLTKYPFCGSACVGYCGGLRGHTEAAAQHLDFAGVFWGDPSRYVQCKLWAPELAEPPYNLLDSCAIVAGAFGRSKSNRMVVVVGRVPSPH
jgi:hypothetical protein